jgi:hypothetical protein
MSNAFGLVLDSASVRRATVEGVPETVIAAIYLLHENSVDAVAAKLAPGELGHVIRLVGRCPSCYPPGTLDALKRRNSTPAPQPPSVSGSNDLTSGRRHARIYGRAHGRRFTHAQGAAMPTYARTFEHPQSAAMPATPTDTGEPTGGKRRATL